jgi:hypothetical protein
LKEIFTIFTVIIMNTGGNGSCGFPNAGNQKPNLNKTDSINNNKMNGQGQAGQEGQAMRAKQGGGGSCGMSSNTKPANTSGGCGGCK